MTRTFVADKPQRIICVIIKKKKEDFFVSLSCFSSAATFLWWSGEEGTLQNKKVRIVCVYDLRSLLLFITFFLIHT